MTSDSDIIRRSLEEPSAFSALFERHARVVAGYAAARVGIDAADDVLSDTFLVAFRKRRTFRTEAESARPWLLGIATRVIHNQRRSEARHLRAMAAAAAIEPTTRPDDAEDSAIRLDADAEVRALAPRVAALHKRDRDTLFLHAGGLSHEEIAAALSVPLGTVKSRLNRVRRQLAAHARDEPPPAATAADWNPQGVLHGHAEPGL